MFFNPVLAGGNRRNMQANFAYKYACNGLNLPVYIFFQKQGR